MPGYTSSRDDLRAVLQAQYRKLWKPGERGNNCDPNSALLILREWAEPNSLLDIVKRQSPISNEHSS